MQFYSALLDWQQFQFSRMNKMCFEVFQELREIGPKTNALKAPPESLRI